MAGMVASEEQEVAAAVLATAMAGAVMAANKAREAGVGEDEVHNSVRLVVGWVKMAAVVEVQPAGPAPEPEHEGEAVPERFAPHSSRSESCLLQRGNFFRRRRQDLDSALCHLHQRVHCYDW